MGGAATKALLARRTPCRFLCWPALRSVLLEILRDHGESGVLSVALVGDREMRRIHREFLGEDTPTDVLSFRLDTDRTGFADGVLGEVVVSVPTALSEATRRKIAPDKELSLYAIHGALHLVGFEDSSGVEAKSMRRAERRYLRRYLALRQARILETPRYGGGCRRVARRIARREAD